MDIHRVPALADNYMYLLHDPQRQEAAAVDPAESEPIERLLAQLGAELVAIFNTHHHFDHVGGNEALKRRHPQARVYGGAGDRGRIPQQDGFLEQGDRVALGDRYAEIVFTPGHTRAQIAYYFPPETEGGTGELFCGDTLFAGGCGRLFEGNAEQMVNSLDKLRALPDATRVWCGHEYTLKNLQFALTVDGDNSELQARLREVQAQRQQDSATVPSQLAVEKRTNPFLRWDAPALQSAAGSADAVATFAQIRRMKDRF